MMRKHDLCEAIVVVLLCLLIVALGFVLALFLHATS
jgi:hypothetical protein